MDLVTDHWLDALGWGGSALLVYSLLQRRIIRLRVLNLAAGVVLLVFNALIQVWPMVGLNAVTSVINVWFLVRLLRERHDEEVFDVLEVGPGDVYLHHLLRTHAEDIARFQPGFGGVVDVSRDHAFVVQRGDETVGVVVVRRDGDLARLRLDYVTPRYRDHTPGEFVFRRSGALRELGFRQVLTPPGMVEAYYGALGFRRYGDQYVLDLF